MEYRPRLDEEEYNIIKDHRALKEECKRIGIPVEDVDHYWHKGKHFSVHAKKKGVSIHKLRDMIIKEMNKHSPSYPKIKRKKTKDTHLLVIDPADIHIGKLASSFETGEDYNSQIAVQRVKEGVAGIIDKAKGFNIDKILFIGGNDILHVDVPSRKTTS